MNLPDIPDEWKYLFGAMSGALITGLVSFINQNEQTKRERQKWQTEKLLDYYQYSITELFELAKMFNDLNIKLMKRDENEDEVEIKEIYEKIKEKCNYLQTYLYLIVNTQHQKSADFKNLKEMIEKFNDISIYIVGTGGLKPNLKKGFEIKKIRENLIKVMKEDKRVNQMFQE